VAFASIPLGSVIECGHGFHEHFTAEVLDLTQFTHVSCAAPEGRRRGVVTKLAELLGLSFLFGLQRCN
jgi:hypothetical protein